MADKMLGSKPTNRRDLLKVGLDTTLYPLPFKKGGKIKCAPGGVLPAAVPQVKVPAVKVPSLGEMRNGGILKQGAPQTMQDAIKMAVGGKFANETFGDKTLDAGPRSMADGGEVSASPPGLGRRIAGAFNKNIRTDNRYQMALQKALSGEGSSSFKAASNFTIPTSGQSVNPGQRVYVTPQLKSRVVTPGTPAVEATPEKREMVQTGTTKKFTPGFVETGAYGSPAPGAPTAGSTYSHFPASIHPELKAALEAAIAGKKDTVEWKGKPYKAGTTTEEPVLEEVVTPGSPAVAGTPAVSEDYIYPVVRKGGSGSKESFWKKLNSTDLGWINKGRLDSPKGTVRYSKKTTSARKN